jgi:hypothetical protein
MTPFSSSSILSTVAIILYQRQVVGSLKMNTTLEYSTRVAQEGDPRCKKSTPNDLAYLAPLRIPLMNPVKRYNMLTNNPTRIFAKKLFL